jgi:uncharacterized membrane protein YeaQ/YmgE (transglycosylase-associated protein family)
MFSIIGAIILGGLAGLIAGNIRKGEGYGLLPNVVIGIVGGGIGSYIFNMMGLNPSESNIIGSLVVSVLGSLLLLTLINLLGKKNV